MSGIYTITNKRNNKLYVGRSVNVFRRLREHKNNLKFNKHVNCYLQAAYNLEPENFLFEVLELYSVDLIVDMEQYWLNMTQAYDRVYGYCLDQSAYNNSKYKLSEETKRKLSISHKGKKLSDETIEKIRQKNTGQSRPTQSLKMRQNWNKMQHLMGWNNFTPEQKIQVSQKLSKATKNRYSVTENLPLTSLEVLYEGVTVNKFPSIHKAEEALGLSKKYLHHYVKPGQSTYIPRILGHITIKIKKQKIKM